ncbi:MAG: DUF3887 domain-containing protein [Clostridia bacterium]
MKRIFCIVLCALVMLCAGCIDVSLAQGFDEASVTDAAKEVVALINAQDYPTIESNMREDLKSQLTPGQLEEALGEKVTSLGAFKEFSSISVIGQKNKVTSEDYAVAVAKCKYDDGNAIYTLSFDVDMALVGIYMK